MADICWILTGAGDVCERKSGPPLYRLPGHRLLAAYRRDRDAGVDFCRRHGPCRYAESLDALLAEHDANAIYIATPPQAHCEQTVAAARAGKYVLVEKPMAMHAGECAEMVQACATAGVVLAVAYYRRCYPSVLRARELLKSGAIGDLQEIELNDQFPPSHRLDLVHFFAGDIARIWTEKRILPPDSHAKHGARLLGETCNHARLAMNIGWHESGPPEQIWLRGSMGDIFIDDLKGGSLICNGEREAFAPLPWPHWGLIENFGKHLRGEAPVACSGEEGRKSTVVLDFASTLKPGEPPVDIDYANPPSPDWMQAQGFNLLG